MHDVTSNRCVRHVHCVPSKPDRIGCTVNVYVCANMHLCHCASSSDAIDLIEARLTDAQRAVDCTTASSPDRVLDDTLRSSLFCQLMYLSPVTLLGIYLYGLCGIAYIGKPIRILVVQQMLGVLLLYVLLQCWICTCYRFRLIIIIAQNVHPAGALSPHQQSCQHLWKSDHDVAVCYEQTLAWTNGCAGC